MGLILDALIEILSKPTVGKVVAELVLFAAPLWIAVLVGLFVGWTWRPRWAAGLVGGDNVGLGGRHLPPSETSSVDPLEARLPSSIGSSVFDKSSGQEANMVVVSSPDGKSEKVAVTEKDLKHLIQLVQVTDGGPVWHQMMDRSLPNMSYQAWRRDPQTGPPQYRCRTVFEDATPEIVRDFFWDDEFRVKNGWDDMLLYHETLKECPTTGTMLVHWIRKFPFFCSDREYTIGRRIWESGRTYYCVTKGVPCHSVPRRNKPRRVDLFHSSWCIRAVESRRGDGQLTACEVLLFHHEDMGIPREIAKLGIGKAMWGSVKRMDRGLRAYQITRRSDEPLSQCAVMAQINTNFNADDLRSLEVGTCSSSEIVEPEKQKHQTGNIPKFLVIGGAVALACTLDHGLLTKAVIFGLARRFAKQ